MKREQQAKVEEAARKKEEQIARRQKEAREAQMAGDAWNARSSTRDNWPKPEILSPSLPSTPPKDSKPVKREELLSMEELDKLADSLKTAAKKLGYS